MCEELPPFPSPPLEVSRDAYQITVREFDGALRQVRCFHRGFPHDRSRWVRLRFSAERGCRGGAEDAPKKIVVPGACIDYTLEECTSGLVIDGRPCRVMYVVRAAVRATAPGRFEMIECCGGIAARSGLFFSPEHLEELAADAVIMVLDAADERRLAKLGYDAFFGLHPEPPWAIF